MLQKMQIRSLRGNSQRGASTTEIGMVLLIFAIVVTLILRAEKMIEATRIKGVVIQAENYKMAAQAFRDKYDTWPGDLDNARSVIADCQDPCRDGNGDKVLETIADMHDQAVDPDPASERVQFWQHLVAEGLLEGDLKVSGLTGWGEMYPASRLLGGWYAYQNAAVPTPTGLWLQLRLPLDDRAMGNDTGVHALTELQARMIDRKYDDGRSDSGRIIGNPNLSNTICGAGGVYDEGNNEFFNCDLLFFVAK